MHLTLGLLWQEEICSTLADALLESDEMRRERKCMSGWGRGGCGGGEKEEEEGVKGKASRV